MAWNTFTPPVAPSQDGYSAKTTVRSLTSTFGDGDGYVQRAPDGMNYVGQTVTLNSSEITAANRAVIKALS